MGAKDNFSSHARTQVASVPTLNPQGSQTGNQPSVDGVYMIVRKPPTQDEVREKLVATHGYREAMNQAAAAHTTVWDGVIAPPTAGRFGSFVRRLIRRKVAVLGALIALSIAGWLLFAL